MSLRYLAAACQTDFANPRDRGGIADHTSQMLGMIDQAVVGYAPFGDVRLVAFPEFAHPAPIFQTVAELLAKLSLPIPNAPPTPSRPKPTQPPSYSPPCPFA